MGDFRIVIESVGGHGCDRDAGTGDKFYGCQRMGCPDCEAKRFVDEFSRRFSISKATFTHWPHDMAERGYKEENEVVDDMAPKDSQGVHQLTQRVRIKGSFKK